MKEIIEAYEKVKAGALSWSLKTQDGAHIRAVWIGDIIRITVHLPKEQLPRRHDYE